MKKERILIADDDADSRETLESLIEVFGKKDGHKIVGSAGSVEEVEKLMEKSLRPTVALVDNRFPLKGDGEKAAEIIRKLSPETKIVSFSTDSNLSWGDENWPKAVDIKILIARLTNLQH